jgi:hypothetical protein
MLRWPFKKKAAPEAAPSLSGRGESAAARGGAEGDEWAFLRSQPDHDAEEMATVHAAASPDDLDWTDESASPSPPPFETGTEPAWAEDGEEAWQPGAAGYAATEDEDALADCSLLMLEITAGRRTVVQTVEGEALVGRRDPVRGLQPEIDLSADPQVSLRHALICFRDGRASVRDLNSRGGTLLNGKWLDPDVETPLSQGDELELGEGSRIRVVDRASDSALTAEDLMLGEMLQEALGGAPEALPASPPVWKQRPAWGPSDTPAADRASDILDLSLDLRETSAPVSPSPGTREREPVLETAARDRAGSGPAPWCPAPSNAWRRADQ